MTSPTTVNVISVSFLTVLTPISISSFYHSNAVQGGRSYSRMILYACSCAKLGLFRIYTHFLAQPHIIVDFPATSFPSHLTPLSLFLPNPRYSSSLWIPHGTYGTTRSHGVKVCIANPSRRKFLIKDSGLPIASTVIGKCKESHDMHT
jgi:hypothetical protein